MVKGLPPKNACEVSNSLRFHSRGLIEISQPKNQGPKFCLVYKWISFPQDFEIQILTSEIVQLNLVDLSNETKKH